MKKHLWILGRVFSQKELMLGVLLGFLSFFSSWTYNILSHKASLAQGKTRQQEILYGALQARHSAQEKKARFLQEKEPLYDHLKERGVLDRLTQAQGEAFLKERASQEKVCCLECHWKEEPGGEETGKVLTGRHSVHMLMGAESDISLYRFLSVLLTYFPGVVRLSRGKLQKGEERGFKILGEFYLDIYTGSFSSGERRIFSLPETPDASFLVSSFPSLFREGEEKEGRKVQEESACSLAPAGPFSLKGILYGGPHQWVLWINNIKITPQSQVPGIVIHQVTPQEVIFSSQENSASREVLKLGRIHP